MDKNKYEIDLFLITKNGIVLSDAATRRVFDGEPEDQVVAEEMPKLDMSDPLAPIKNLTLAKDIDIFYPVVHCNLGEDGTLQGQPL